MITDILVSIKQIFVGFWAEFLWQLVMLDIFSHASWPFECILWRSTLFLRQDSWSCLVEGILYILIVNYSSDMWLVNIFFLHRWRRFRGFSFNFKIDVALFFYFCCPWTWICFVYFHLAKTIFKDIFKFLKICLSVCKPVCTHACGGQKTVSDPMG